LWFAGSGGFRVIALAGAIEENIEGVSGIEGICA
jgi:hypothetical protein